MGSTPTTSSVSRSLYLEIRRVAAQAGLGTSDPPALAAASQGRLPVASVLRLLRELRRQDADPDLGLKLGTSLQPACFAVTGHLVMASSNVLTALPLIERYQDLVMDSVRLRHALGDQVVHLRWRLDTSDPELPREFSDLLMAAIRQFGIWLTGITEPFLETCFDYPRPRQTARHEAMFGPNLRFDAGENGFSFPLAWADRPIRSADSSLVPLLEMHASQLLRQLRSERFIATVSQVLLEGLTTGEHAIAAVASRLCLSPRALQRQLKSQGTTFNDLLQEIRLEMANFYLADPRIPLADIAGRLGYQEQSSFSHAYRQWTGSTPQAVRTMLTCAPG